MDLMMKCVNAHAKCSEGGPCPYCEPVVPLRYKDGSFAKTAPDRKADTNKNTGELVCLSRINGMGEPDPMGSYVKFEWLPDDESGRLEFVTNETVAQDLVDDVNQLFHPC